MPWTGHAAQIAWARKSGRRHEVWSVGARLLLERAAVAAPGVRASRDARGATRLRVGRAAGLAGGPTGAVHVGLQGPRRRAGLAGLWSCCWATRAGRLSRAGLCGRRREGERGAGLRPRVHGPGGRRRRCWALWLLLWIGQTDRPKAQGGPGKQDSGEGELGLVGCSAAGQEKGKERKHDFSFFNLRTFER
jgi:hypothetical protein